MSDEKYVVFKRDELAARYQDVRGTDAWNEWMAWALKDAVVIRTKDPFAAPALYAYARTISHQAAMLRQVVKDVPWNKQIFESIDNLTDIAEYFESAAQEAEEIFMAGDWKVPD